MFKKKEKRITIIKKKQHKNKNKAGASLDGLFLWLGLNSLLRELNRGGLKVLTALTWGNSLKGLNKESWLLDMSGLSLSCRLCSLLGRFRVQAFTCFCHPRRLALLGRLIRRSCSHSNLKSSSLSLLRNIPNLGAGGGSFIPGPLCDIFGPLCLGQLFLQIGDLLLGNLQLVLNLE